jgi:hypothetical protein
MFSKQNSIPLFWWSSIKFEKKSSDNFGDLVGPYIVKKITGKNIYFIHPKKRKWHQLFTRVFVTAGSILPQIDKNCVVWGAGIIEKTIIISKAQFLAVRGPITREVLIKQGCIVPEVYGDPAILLPKFYNPQKTKTYKTGIIPHYVDYELVFNWYKDNPNFKIINLLNSSVEQVIDEICMCEKIISSSLHGIIVSHSYNIPALWVKFSDKIFGDDTKFYDYFESVELFNILPVKVNNALTLSEWEDMHKKDANFIPPKVLELLQNKLLEACPF